MKLKLFFLYFALASIINCSNDFDFNDQEFTDAQKNEMAPCRKYWGKDLVNCMQHCNNREYKINLLLLDTVSGQRTHFFEQTLKNSAEYNKLDKVHENEIDWQALWENLSNEEKEKFFKNPNTLLVASSKENLKAFIKKLEADEEYWKKVYIATGVGVGVVIVGGIVLYYGPSIIANLPNIPAPSIPV